MLVSARATPESDTSDMLQVVHSPYKGISDCVKRMLREEGIGAFYKSYRTTVRTYLR